MIKPRLVFIHGWGNDKSALAQLGSYFAGDYDCVYLELPGFGSTPPPLEVWSDKDYADYAAKMIEGPAVIIGLSFGGRVAIQLAANHPELVESIVVIAGSGIRVPKPLWTRLKHWIIKKLRLKGLAGADYKRSTGVMRSILVKAVTGDIREDAREVEVPALLIYGVLDTAAPPYAGQIYREHIKGSILHVLDGQTHQSLIHNKRFPVQQIIEKFLGH